MTSPVSAPKPDPRTRLAVLPQPRHWLLASVLLSALTLAVGFTVTSAKELTAAEFGADQVISAHHVPVLNVLALAIVQIFSPVGGVLMLVLICLFLLLVRKSPVNAIAVGAVVCAGWLSSEVFKLIVGRHRPDPAALADPLVPEPGTDSFPSGHTALAVSLCVALYLLSRGTRWQRPALLAGIAVALTVAASRVYLGVHYPSDVTASFLTSFAGILALTGLWNRHALRLLHRITILCSFVPVPSSVPGRRSGNHR
ncbi:MULTISPECIES: phosphatase PAP2 family protein [unclassified Paenarthrobacter]|uniref:phosphatase PAP2 family protein n=1 Tax=unclassified Paenarthrobacter TaxID=2634190 RepID=UPI000B1F9744|nr:phosphatase PAP2 family protein [Paenarthrobacter sp. R1]WIV29244.1 phosphatase PAP2 family protein [Paenarthrobacter sp. R1]